MYSHCNSRMFGQIPEPNAKSVSFNKKFGRTIKILYVHQFNFWFVKISPVLTYCSVIVMSPGLRKVFNNASSYSLGIASNKRIADVPSVRVLRLVEFQHICSRQVRILRALIFPLFSTKNGKDIELFMVKLLLLIARRATNKTIRYQSDSRR